MPDDGVGGAVLDAPEAVQADISGEESTESTETGEEQIQQPDRQDNRRQPDAFKKKISELRRQAELITDPVAKKAALDDIKSRYDTNGKLTGYEEQWPTVREAREVRAMLESVGGREGFQQLQARHAETEQNDAALAAGDPSIIEKMWQHAPEGMPKLIPHMIDRFAKEKPQEYQQFIAPKSIGYLDQAGFPQAFDRMVQMYEAGKTEDAQALRDQLIQWVSGNRQQAQQQKQVDPEVERLRQENERLRQGDESKQVESAYGSVVDHAGPSIDRVAKPIIGKYGFTSDENTAFKQAVWDHLQQTRNADATYKTIAPAKQRQGYDKWTEYAKRWTDDNAEASIRAVLKTPPWSRLQNGVKQPVAVTRAPGAPQVQTGKQPEPSEIDYSAKGIMAAKKAGFRDLQDMLISGQAPLKAGGIRKWR